MPTVSGHPNHLIILVDASKSMQHDPSRRASARRAQEALLDGIYGGAKLPGLPAFDPKKDLISVEQFGIDTSGESSTAYRRLKWHNLRTDYLHPRLHAVDGVQRARLQEALRPVGAYNLTALAWARAMGLREARVTPEKRVQRTFLLILSDAETNGGTMAEEADVLEHYARPEDAAWIRNLRRQVGKEYRFVGLEDVEEPLFEREFRAFRKAKPVFLSAYEVRYRPREREAASIAAIPAFRRIDMGWVREGDRPEVEVDATPSEALRKRLGGQAPARVAAGSEEGHGQGETGRLADDLSTPLRFRALPDDSTFATVRLVVSADQAGGWLGTRTTDFVFSTSAAVPVPGSRTIGYRAGLWFLVLSISGAVGAVAWALYSWKAGRHFRLKLPGYGNPILLPALGTRVAPVTDQVPQPAHAGGEAFRVLLPPMWMRRIFYRDATLSLASNDGEVRWVGQSGTEVPIAAFNGDAVATWDDVPPYSTQAGVTVRRGPDACAAEIAYPGPKALPATIYRPSMKHYVALDLGSDSMAAVYATDDGQDLRMVPLQHFAPLMIRQPDLLTAVRGDGEAEVSPRLRSRIELQENQAERTLPEWHATLDFFDLSKADPTLLPGCNQSVFRFFQPSGLLPSVNKTLPNPKVMFQYGIRDAFPNFRTVTGEALEVSPETAIGHLTTQVLRNLVLRSPVLSGIDPRQVEVILTVPNVYSVEHAEKLRRTVEFYAGVGRVSTISESDALAYFYLSKPRKRGGAGAAPDEPGAATQILTIDVGRGTTDLSLIQTQIVDSEEHAWVRARTGRSSGGGELTYLFVQFYEREIRRIFRQYGSLLGDLGDQGPMIEPPMSFLWIKNQALVADLAYPRALYAMADLVEEVKKAFNERYRMTTPTSAEPAIETIVSGMMRFVEIGYLDVPGWADANSEGIAKFRERLREALHVDADLGTGVLATWKERPKRSFSDELRGMWREMLARLKGSRRVKTVDKPAVVKSTRERDTANLDWLGREIRSYVQANVHQLLIELGAMVANRTDAQAFGSLGSLREEVDLAIQSIVESGRTHVVIGGQASQFGPIRRALRELFSDRVGRDIVALDMLTGQEAKDACSKGAVVYATSGHRPMNRDALHGTYGFVKVAQTDDEAQVYSVRMQELNNEGKDLVRTPTSVGHYFVFTPGAFHPGKDWDDGMVSRLGRFEGREFCVTYGSEEEGGLRRLAVNGEPVRLGNFGELKDNIWKKVWPDQLPREPQN